MKDSSNLPEEIWNGTGRYRQRDSNMIRYTGHRLQQPGTVETQEKPAQTKYAWDHSFGGFTKYFVLPVNEDLVALLGDDVDVWLWVGPALYGWLQQWGVSHWVMFQIVFTHFFHFLVFTIYSKKNNYSSVLRIEYQQWSWHFSSLITNDILKAY